MCCYPLTVLKNARRTRDRRYAVAPMISYRYELRDGNAIIATGHISYEVPLELGDLVTLGKTAGIVRDLGPRLAGSEVRLLIQLRPPGLAETA